MKVQELINQLIDYAGYDMALTTAYNNDLVIDDEALDEAINVLVDKKHELVILKVS